MLDLTIHRTGLKNAVKRARERGIVIPTFAEMQDPSRVPEKIRRRLKKAGLWDLDPLNLFRINWKNEPQLSGGGFGEVNCVEFPRALTGVKARILALAGRWFPTGAHKVGAAFGCLAPRLVTGQFDPTRQKAVWPSTGNYCRGGAYDSALLGCESVAILPEGMSRERFEWLSKVAGEVIRTPGTESNVKEIFDKCNELRASGQDLMIFNQFDDHGNRLWHCLVTGQAMKEALEKKLRPGQTLSGAVFTTGSAGTIAAGDSLKEWFPGTRVAASEALQCPTLLNNGFGAHRIEGIGDKHIPWIHNVRNTDMVMAVDDESVMQTIRLFNEPAGRAYMARMGVPKAFFPHLPLIGISGAANLLSSIKMAEWYGWDENSVIITVLTDSMEMYGSRLRELAETNGRFTEKDAVIAWHKHLSGQDTADMEELTQPARKRIHNLKYYTWVEQQGKNVRELEEQWEKPSYWSAVRNQKDEIDGLIREFNAMTGVLRSL